MFKKIFTIIFVVKSLKAFGWNDGGPTLFHNWAMYRVIRLVAFRGIKRHPYCSQCKHGQSPNSVAMLSQRRIRLTGNEPTMGCDAGPTWISIGWVGLYCVYQVYRIDAYTDLSAMVVGLHVKDILVSLVLSIIIGLSWTFRILAHEEKQYSYVYKLLGHFFV